MSKTEQPQKFSSNILQRFFWNCAGADLEILSRKDCQTERKKQDAIGRLLMKEYSKIIRNS